MAEQSEFEAIIESINGLGKRYDRTVIMRVTQAVSRLTSSTAIPPEKFMATALAAASSAHALVKMQAYEPNDIGRVLRGHPEMLQLYRDGAEALELAYRGVKMVLKEYEQ